MKQFFLIAIAVLFFNFCGNAQVATTNWDNISKRIQNGADTLYVVNFWATWCGPCVKELPYFDALPKQENGVPLKVLLLSMDFRSDLQKKVIPFVKKRKVKSEVLLLHEEDEQALIDRVDSSWSGALPATLFIYGAKNKRLFYGKEVARKTLNEMVQNIIK